MDEFEARYREIAGKFILMAHRGSPALAEICVQLAAHYEMLAELHTKYADKSIAEGFIRPEEQA